MSTSQVFTPIPATASLSVTTSSSRVSLGISGFSEQSWTIRVVSDPASASIAFIQFGTATVTATTAAMPILPGAIETFQIPSSFTNVAAITGISTATFYFTPGQGA